MCAFLFLDASIDFGFVKGAAVGIDFGSMFNTTAFWVICAKIKSFDPRKRNCLSAHGAGFQRDVNITII